MANLWDVTDKDIDLFTQTLMETWGVFSGEPSAEPGLSLPAAVAFARTKCNLKYLNGAAPVVYGLPVFAKRN